jgi:hypothetical protein
MNIAQQLVPADRKMQRLLNQSVGQRNPPAQSRVHQTLVALRYLRSPNTLRETPMVQQSLIQLVVAWTLVGGFVLTVLLTLASMIGLVKFSDSKQQQKMFYILIVQIVVISVSYFGKLLNYSPAVAADDAVKLSSFDYWKSFHHEGVAGIEKPGKWPVEYRYAFDSVEGKIKFYSDLNVYVETNKRLNSPAYYYYFRPIKVDDEFLYVYDDSRAFALKLPLRSGMSYFSGHGGNGPFSEFHSLIAL